MEKARRSLDIVILGFALFAMFFGAGNLVFPPYLGAEAGESWLSAFLTFIVSDAGFAVVALIAAIIVGGMGKLSECLTKPVSNALTFIVVMCIGPLVCIPRTAATTFELGVMPILPDCPAWASAAVFFTLVFILTVRPGKVVDIVGKVISPLMLAALVALIVMGIVNPIGVIPSGADAVTSAKRGLESGYQTMDMLAALLFGAVVINDVKRRNITGKKAQLKAAWLAGIVACAGLFIVYGGLAYIGATAGGSFDISMGRSALLVAITGELLGPWGSALLGFIVVAACLTTAIGLTASAAEGLGTLFKNKLGYGALVGIICAIGFALANIGLTGIIELASPALELLYPIFVTLIALAFFSKRAWFTLVGRFASVGAFTASALLLIESYGVLPIKLGFLPFHELGLGWVVPAVIFGLAGAVAFRMRHTTNGRPVAVASGK